MPTAAPPLRRCVLQLLPQPAAPGRAAAAHKCIVNCTARLGDKPSYASMQAMVPCSEAEKEAQPVTIPFSTTINAPVDCLWAKIDAWSTDYSWVEDTQVP